MVLKFTADRPGMQNLIFSYGSNPEAIGDIKVDGPNRLLYTGCLKNDFIRIADNEFAISRVQASSLSLIHIVCVFLTTTVSTGCWNMGKK